MAYGISHFFPGGTQAQYEATMVAMNGELGIIPDGQIFHAAGPAAGGWQIVAVHDTKESWDAFVESCSRTATRSSWFGGARSCGRPDRSWCGS